ncbi:MAG: ADP-forming succinate--CoA ligase subunit beta [Elusimicrobia bacterium]|nr:ADP-forming succinate--CoA ligase subunit beta [Elusimicrobiota bacterium]
MKLHEFQAKRRMESFGLPVLKGAVIDSVQSVAGALAPLGPGPWVLKAQIHAGGRGKAGGVRVVRTVDEAKSFVSGLLDRPLVTHQTGPEGLMVRSLIAEPAVTVKRELYAAVAINRKTGRPTLIVSGEGGVDIETLAATSPEKIIRVEVDPWRGLDAFQARDVAFAVGLGGDLLRDSVRFFQNLVKLFLESDAGLVEVNPLGILSEKGGECLPGGECLLLAMDAKMTIDDNAAFRQGDLLKGADTADLSEAERRAAAVGISYIRLDGSIGCLVNGAGLAMATMDIIKLHGGDPANFLDVGGGASVTQVTEAFEIILSDPRVRVVLVNIFGGIMKCDVIAEGIVQAVKTTGLDRPLVVRLEGNRVQEGRAVLADSGLQMTSATDLADAAQKAVALAGGRS